MAAAGGVALAILFSLWRVLEYSLYPYAVILQVTPIVAIAPLLLIYLSPSVAVLVCAFLVAFFPLLANTTLGLSSATKSSRGRVAALVLSLWGLYVLGKAGLSIVLS